MEEEEEEETGMCVEGGRGALCAADERGAPGGGGRRHPPVFAFFLLPDRHADAQPVQQRCAMGQQCCVHSGAERLCLRRGGVWFARSSPAAGQRQHPWMRQGGVGARLHCTLARRAAAPRRLRLARPAVPGDRVTSSGVISDLSKAVASSVGKPEAVRGLEWVRAGGSRRAVQAARRASAVGCAAATRGPTLCPPRPCPPTHTRCLVRHDLPHHRPAHVVCGHRGAVRLCRAHLDWRAGRGEEQEDQRGAG